MRRYSVSFVTIITIVTILQPICARGQWVQLNGPYGAAVFGFATNGASIYAAVSSNYEATSLFVTTNDGRSWTPISAPWHLHNYTQSFVANKDRLFAMSDEGLFYTRDGGTTWTRIRDTSWNGSAPTCLLSSDSVLYAGIGSYSFVENQGLFRSLDNGDTWMPAATGITNSHVHALASSGSRIFAGTSRGIFASSNRSTDWNLVDSFTMVSCLCVSGPTILAGTPTQGIRRSTDDGLSWITTYPATSDSSIRCFASIENQVFALAGQHIYRSSDHGAAWYVTAPLPRNSGSPIVLSTSGSDLLVGTWRGVFLSSDLGMSWKDITSNMIANGANSIEVNPLDSLLYVSSSGSGGAWISRDDGITWMRPDSGYMVATDLVRNSDAWIVGGARGIYRSTDEGISWIKSADSGLQQWETLHQGFAYVNGTLLVTGSRSGICRSTDDGARWIPSNNGLVGDDSTSAGSIITVGGTLFAETWRNLYRSADEGDTWVCLPVTWPEYARIEMIVAHDQSLFVVLGGSDSSGLYRSDNAGDSWEYLSSYPASSLPTQLLFSGPNIIAVAGILYWSSDNGSTWAAIDTGGGINALALKGQFGFAGMSKAGVWRRPISEMIGKAAVERYAKNAWSVHAYPNPFYSSTQIEITAQGSGHADITVTNALGVEVAKLFSGELSTPRLSWNRPDWLPDGVFFCRVRIDDVSHTMPIVVRH